MRCGFVKRAVCIIFAWVLVICFVSCTQREGGKEKWAQSSAYVFSEVDRIEMKENVVCADSAYKIEFEFELLSNNCVGNEWEKCVFLNGKEIESGETITAKSEECVDIKVEITEKDKIPDSGSGSEQLLIKDGQSGSIKIKVCENRGQYSANAALWEFRYSISADNT